MRVDLDAKVRTRDGHDAGAVQRAVIDPRADAVSDFVISTGVLLGYDVLVPRDRLESASRDGDTIALDLTRDELEKMPVYEAADYTVPATGWVPPAGYGYPTIGFLWPAGHVFSEPAPSSARGPAEVEVWPTIDKGTVVRDRDAHEVGVVDDLRFDTATGRLEGLVIRAGGAIQTFFGGGHTIEISRSQVERVDEGEVHLRASKDELG